MSFGKTQKHKRRSFIKKQQKSTDIWTIQDLKAYLDENGGNSYYERLSFIHVWFAFVYTFYVSLIGLC